MMILLSHLCDKRILNVRFISSEMVQHKTAVFIFSATLILYMFYYNYHDNIKVHLKINTTQELRTREPIYIYKGSEDFLINTTGCYIPNYGKSFKFNERKKSKKTCNQRAIFVQRIDSDSIIFQIDNAKMKTYSIKKMNFECCYAFAKRSSTAGKEDNELSYTQCRPFKSGYKTPLLEEIVTVRCLSLMQKKKSIVIYEDSYIIIKKQQNNRKLKNQNWNVLVVGMDTMSRARILSSMPKTFKYLQQNDWLDYKGYNKVGYNTFPNLVAILTGKILSSFYRACVPDMFACNDFIIWSTFRKAGYITAYGEDNLRLPDTFFRHNGFKSIPTNHYMRPFFLTGEHQSGNLICTRRQSSAKHVFDYAYDFVDTYKKENFFGVFWMNSISHNEDYLPELHENDVLHFFEQINKTGIINNTFIFLISDHGMRTGPMRVPIESYYEERLPMFFVWVPTEFRRKHKEMYYNLQTNQNRLVTPYDLYKTLVKISDMSRTDSDIGSEACPLCKTIFEEISHSRDCSDAGISDKWCTCHDIRVANLTTDVDARTSLDLVVAHVKDKASTRDTIDCMECHSLELSSVMRIHSYRNENKTYYVVAIRMNPGKVAYEGTVIKDKENFSILEGVSTLTGYNARGNCVKNDNDRMYCVCKKIRTIHSFK